MEVSQDNNKNFQWFWWWWAPQENMYKCLS